MSEEFIQNEDQLEDFLSQPDQRVTDTMGRMEGDLLLLGAGGKMGPSLARMAKRASVAAGNDRRVIAVSRFGQSGLRERLDQWEVETVACDLLQENQLNALPRVANIIFMVGMKFGSEGAEPRTWAMNSWLPGAVMSRFPDSRVVAFSTGNVYGLTPIDGGGSREEDTPRPIGEYAMSCLGRERVIQFFRQQAAQPAALIRLNYACELRYGVLVDIGRQVWNDQPIDLAMGYFNTIWQTDANRITLRAFDHLAAPPRLLNLTGPERLSVREVAEDFGRCLGKTPHFQGRESETALLSDARRSLELFGPPSHSPQWLLRQIADWILQGGVALDKPTHFESRDGRF